MEIIESVIETYEMRTGNSTSANAARESLAQLRADLDEAIKVMENITEYWNGNSNKNAMLNALQHDEGIASAFLARTKEKK